MPPTIVDCALDLTSLAQSVMLAASVVGEPTADGYLAAWETLTGLSGEEAIAAAKTIAEHPAPVQAVVIPF